LNEDAAWLAGHFEQGGDWPRAIRYLQFAAAAFQAQERPHRQVEEKQKRIEFLDQEIRPKRRSGGIEARKKNRAGARRRKILGLSLLHLHCSCGILGG